MITSLSADNDPHNYAHGSPHSPHTAPDPMIQVQPEYSQQHSISSPSSAYQNHDYSSTTTNSPHTAVLQYDSPNPNPQLGYVQLDFIPLPTNRPSAPPQPSTTISAEARNSSAPLPYVAPPPPVPYPSTPYPVCPSANTQQPNYENVTFVDATPIDMSNNKHKLSPTAGGSTVFEDLRNPRKKAFWIFNIVVLAIIFGVLGATVWKPDSSKDNEYRGVPTPSLSTGPRSNTVALTPVAAPATPTSVTAPLPPTSTAVPVVPTPVVVPSPGTAPPPPPPPPPRPSLPPKPTGGGGGGGDFSCERACSDASNKCDGGCATDSSYKSCTAKCAGQAFCDFDCQQANGCFRGCMDSWSACVRACG